MTTYTILIIDDHKEQAMDIKKQIEQLDSSFQVDIANDADYALKGTYDAYLSDIMMPIHSGIEIGNMIYKKNPEAIIMLMSSLDSHSDGKQLFSTFAFIPKAEMAKRLPEVLKQLKKVLEYNHVTITVEQDGQEVEIPVHKIRKVKRKKHQLMLELKDASYPYEMDWEAFQQQYDRYFMCPKNKLLVNPGYAFYYEAGHSIQMGKETISVSIFKRKACKEKFSAYLKEFS